MEALETGLVSIGCNSSWLADELLLWALADEIEKKVKTSARQ
jgi:hypothetical protein